MTKHCCAWTCGKCWKKRDTPSQAKGHTVAGEAENGKIAVSLAERERPDLVIMDVKMPEMDGLEAAKLIGEAKLAPVLLLTAYSQQEIVQEATNSGVFAYLVKPVREEELFPAIEIAISRFAAFQRLNAALDKAKDDLETRNAKAQHGSPAFPEGSGQSRDCQRRDTRKGNGKKEKQKMNFYS